MRRLTKIFIIVLFISGCSVTRSSLSESEKKQDVVENRDILTTALEDIEISIPPELFASIYGKKIKMPDSTDTDSVSVSNTNSTPVTTDPVTIKISKKKMTQDQSEITTETKTNTKSETKVKKETKGLFGFGGGFILAIFAVLVIAGWVVIKFYF